jgi:hypothetical protein
LFVCVANDLHRRAAGSQLTGDKDLNLAMVFHSFPEEFNGGLAIASLCDKAFQNRPFMIHSPPKIVRPTVDLHEHLVQMPLPVCSRPHSITPSRADLCGKHRARFVPPKPDGLMADVDASLVQKIFHVATRKRKSNTQHHCKADDLDARVEISKWAVFCYQATLGRRIVHLKPVSSDSAASRVTSWYIDQLGRD